MIKIRSIRDHLIKKEKIKNMKQNLEKYENENKFSIEKFLKDGNLIYELYAIFIHSGGAYGGHYFTLIKSFEDKKWYKFDDMRVEEFDIEDIPNKSFGGGKNSSAYMLLYRLLEEEKVLILLFNILINL